MASILAFREAPVDYAALRYNVDIPRGVSFCVVPLLPILDAWEQRTTVADRHHANLYIDYRLKSESKIL